MPENTVELIKLLKNNGINPILYGSQGVSLYLGNFKVFGDIDLLVKDEYLNEKWYTLQGIMNKAGYSLINAHEHEFENDNNQLVAFASEQILRRDSILNTLDEVIEVSLGDDKIKTLSAKDFIKAYEFSKKDGYRKNNRGKKDKEIISLLKDYILEE